MPRNLKNQFRTVLINQRRAAVKFGGRDKLKNIKQGKYADYNKIFSDTSQRTHVSRSRTFATWLKEMGVNKWDQITPEICQKYLIHDRDDLGLSASTIGEDALMINHLMVGTGHWHENQKINKAKITGMPKRSQDIAKQREQNLNSKEWRERYPHKYAEYKNQIDTIRAFGLRRRELVGGSHFSGKDGLGSQSLYRDNKGHIWAIVQGKGGKIRKTECRHDMEREMNRLYGEIIHPISTMPNNVEFKNQIRLNKPVYQSLAHTIPSHIFRADYAQHKLQELASKTFNGKHGYSYYERAGRDENGNMTYSRETRYHDLNEQYQIGAFKAPYGAFYELSDMMGHNRLDVLNSYLGIGR